MRARYLKLAAWLLIILLIASSIAGWLYFKDRNSGPLPKSIRQSVSFPIYYPKPLPAGYIYKKGSASYQNGILFYTLVNDSQSVLISEQAIPANPPDLGNIPGFKKFQTLAGDAVIGSNLGKPVAIILSNTTLISMTGSQKMPNDALVRLASGLQSIPN